MILIFNEDLEIFSFEFSDSLNQMKKIIFIVTPKRNILFVSSRVLINVNRFKRASVVDFALSRLIRELNLCLT